MVTKPAEHSVIPDCSLLCVPSGIGCQTPGELRHLETSRGLSTLSAATSSLLKIGDSDWYSEQSADGVIPGGLGRFLADGRNAAFSAHKGKCASQSLLAAKE